MLPVLLVGTAGHLKVILEGKTEGKLVLDPVHLALEGVAGVAKTKRHIGILEQAKWSCDGCFADVVWMHGDLMIPLPQINLAENFATSRSICKIQHVGKRVGVGLCHQIEAAEVATRPP